MNKVIGSILNCKSGLHCPAFSVQVTQGGHYVTFCATNIVNAYPRLLQTHTDMSCVGVKCSLSNYVTRHLYGFLIEDVEVRAVSN